MVNPQENEVTVSFPAQQAFSRLGRVSVGGLATRLALDIPAVEELRLAADAAVRILEGEGRITITTQWGDGALVVRLENPLADIEDHSDLGTGGIDALVEKILEPPSRIFLRVCFQTEAHKPDNAGQQPAR